MATVSYQRMREARYRREIASLQRQLEAARAEAAARRPSQARLRKLEADNDHKAERILALMASCETLRKLVHGT